METLLGAFVLAISCDAMAQAEYIEKDPFVEAIMNRGQVVMIEGMFDRMRDSGASQEEVLAFGDTLKEITKSVYTLAFTDPVSLHNEWEGPVTAENAQDVCKEAAIRGYEAGMKPLYSIEEYNDAAEERLTPSV